MPRMQLYRIQTSACSLNQPEILRVFKFAVSDLQKWYLLSYFNCLLRLSCLYNYAWAPILYYLFSMALEIEASTGTAPLMYGNTVTNLHVFTVTRLIPSSSLKVFTSHKPLQAQNNYVGLNFELAKHFAEMRYRNNEEVTTTTAKRTILSLCLVASRMHKTPWRQPTCIPSYCPYLGGIVPIFKQNLTLSLYFFP